jgi:primosomal protein N' (replication factor Y) (superfamily II helicase)
MNGNSKRLYADVILPLALGKLFTYSIPLDLNGQILKGFRVVVQFGKSKMYTALVYEVYNRKPEHYDAKDILEVLDVLPAVTEKQFKLWEWIAEYYLCTLGEIMIAALPAAMKMQSENSVTLSAGLLPDQMVLTEDEEVVINRIKEKNIITVADASKLAKNSNGLKLVWGMMSRGILVHHEEMKNHFMPRQVTFVRLSPKGLDENFMREAFTNLEKKAPRQLELLMGFLKLKMDNSRDFFTKSFLLKSTGSSANILAELVKKGILETFEAETATDISTPAELSVNVVLSEMQQAAFNAINENFESGKVTLLHGITSSGKTEVYVRLINEIITSGKQVLYLLPEIALTTQIIGRLKNHFGDRLLVFHSRFSSRERAEVYMQMLNDGRDGKFRYPIIVGARSSIFLPLKNAGLIIVDEEHESSFKQHDPAPRYNARDTAIVCGHLYNCNVLLGSATPSLESYNNAESGKYSLVTIKERYGGLKLPLIKIIDLKDSYRKKQMKSHFSQQLLEGIKSALDAGEQVILFQNRRGFAPVIECKNCGWIPHCMNCDVTLTYHKKSNNMRCHYCGYTTYTPVKCQACGDSDVRMKGMGTERIEDEISIFFPEHRIERLDLDTTGSKSSFLRIITAFENRDIDILVGTQMVTKGLDFDNVGLVGVISADSLINFPDFRAVEKSYQLLGQVSGRAGRKFKQGRVIIQTYQPNHPLLQFLVNNDYIGFYQYEVAEREQFSYPPFFRLIEIRLKHRDDQELNSLAVEFCKEMRSVFGKRVLGPVIPDIARVRNFYLRNVLLKVEKTLPNHKVKEMITKVCDRFLAEPDNRSLIIQIDVDPV